MMQPTIAAIATPYGKGAISIIRISGSEAITLSSNLFKNNHLENLKPNQMVHTQIIENNKIIDDVMVTTYKSPNHILAKIWLKFFVMVGFK